MALTCLASGGASIKVQLVVRVCPYKYVNHTHIHKTITSHAKCIHSKNIFAAKFTHACNLAICKL